MATLHSLLGLINGRGTLCANPNLLLLRDPAVAVSEAEEGAGRGTLALVGDLAHSAAASAATLARDAVLGRPGGYRAGAPCSMFQHKRLRGRGRCAGTSCGHCRGRPSSCSQKSLPW